MRLMGWTTDLLRNEHLSLRAPRTSDRELVARILTDLEVRRFLGGPGAALLSWVWETTSAPAVIAVTHAANRRSLDLLGRLGFAFDSTS